MADRGYREAITYTFVDPLLQRQLFPETRLSLVNPISADLSEMRVSLWSGLIPAAAKICAGSKAGCGCSRSAINSSLVRGAELREIETLAGVATGARWPEQWGSAREAWTSTM